MPDHFNYISFGDRDYVAQADGVIEMNRGRMFEYTPAELEKRLEGLEPVSTNFLETLPTFLCSEVFRSGATTAMVVKFGRIANIDADRKEVRATFQVVFDFGEVEFDDIEAARAVFGAEKFQLYRTHWAVREGDPNDVVDRLLVLRPDLIEAWLARPQQAPAPEGPLPPREKEIIGRAVSVEGFLRLLHRTPALEGHQTFFRGHHDATFELTPSLLRKNAKGDWLLPHEERLCRELLLAHYDEFQSDQYSFDRLVRMQHYGLPTRLLDITTNPLMALYFACEGPPRLAKKEGEVILFSVAAEKVKYYDSDTVSCLSNLSLLTFEQKNRIDFSADPAAFNRSEPVQKLLHHIKSEKGFFEDRIVPEHLQSILCVKAKLSNSRIRSQSGALLLFGHEATLPDAGTEHIAVKRITIRNKAAILDQLDRLNVNAKTVYPSIDQTAKHLKSQYL